MAPHNNEKIHMYIDTVYAYDNDNNKAHFAN